MASQLSPGASAPMVGDKCWEASGGTGADSIEISYSRGSFKAIQHQKAETW